MNIDYLEWDSRFFGHKIGSFTDIDVNTDVLYQQAFDDKYDLVYLFLDKPLIHEYNYNIRLVDKKTTYEYKIGDYVQLGCEIVEYKKEINSELIELALQSGHKSRFHNDKKLLFKFKELYIEWMKNSLNKLLADVVFVYYDNNKIKGMVTAKKESEIVKIGLIAVDSKYRGMGIGRALLGKVINWGRDFNCKNCSVVTQLDNTSACIMYEKAMFYQVDIQNVYHFWLKTSEYNIF